MRALKVPLEPPLQPRTFVTAAVFSVDSETFNTSCKVIFCFVHLVDFIFWNIVNKKGLPLGSMQVFYKHVWRGGAHWALMWHLNRSDLCQCLMPDYAQRCRTSTLIMVPINFWRNSDPFKKKEHFSSSKIDQVRAFFVNPSNFQK